MQFSANFWNSKTNATTSSVYGKSVPMLMVIDDPRIDESNYHGLTSWALMGHFGSPLGSVMLPPQ
jgi:hypothetical protein